MGLLQIQPRIHNILGVTDRLGKEVTFQAVLERIIIGGHCAGIVLWRAHRTGAMHERGKPGTELGPYSHFGTGAVCGIRDGNVAHGDVVVADRSCFGPRRSSWTDGQNSLSPLPLLGKRIFLVVERRSLCTVRAVRLCGVAPLPLQQSRMQRHHVVSASDADVLEVGDGANGEIRYVRSLRRLWQRADDLTQAADTRHTRWLRHR